MTPFPRSRRDVKPLSPRVEEMLGGVARRSAPDGTLERILALHAAGSVYADVSTPRGRLLSLASFGASFGDVARLAIPAAAAAAIAFALVPGGAAAPAGAGPAIPMVAHADVPASHVDLRVVNDPTLASYALRYVAGGDAP
jgi:hypothetical protein